MELSPLCAMGGMLADHVKCRLLKFWCLSHPSVLAVEITSPFRNQIEKPDEAISDIKTIPGAAKSHLKHLALTAIK